MHLFYVSQRLLGGQAHSSFHTLKQEANHLLCGIKVSLALGQFFPRDGLFAAAVVGNQWGWEQGMNSMNGCLADCWDVCAVCRLGRGVAEVIDIYLQEFSQGIRATLEGDLHDFHQGFNRVLWEGNVIVHKVLGQVLNQFCNSTEEFRAFHPSHLYRCWNDQADWFPCGLREDICKVKTICLLNHKAPEAITYVKLAEEDVKAPRGVPHVVK